MPNQQQSQQRVYVDFTSDEFDKIASELFQVTGFDGVEAISELFHFEIDLLSTDPDIALDSMVGKNASLKITKDGELRTFHGVIALLEQGEEAQFDHYCYKAVLKPRLWLMSLSKQNQIYQEQSVPEIIQHEIIDGNYTGDILEDDIDNRMAETYAAREYTVQYKETDFAFISRLIEHEGIYYYFEHGDGVDKIVFCDEKSKLDTLRDENIVSYVPKSGLASFEEQAIHSFKTKQAQISKEIILKDYNYRQPHLPLQGAADTNDLGYGRKYAYGDHFKDPEQGDKLAVLRAQMELCQQRTYLGTSDALFFQAGKLIQVEDHYRESLNKEYLITRIRHLGGQALPGVAKSAGSGEAFYYQNEFFALPSEVEFRPDITTPIPKLYGIMTAVVDGAQNNDRAQIDDQGRYKVVMPFDVSGNGEGKASRWVRKAESYGGQGTGMHFPLLKGSEVIWSCIDGDLDRPIITGVVPNPLNKSVVSSANSTRNVIKTPGGMVMTMDDGGPSSAGGSSQQQQTRMEPNVPVTFSAASSQLERELISQQQHSGAATTTDKVGVDEGSTATPATATTPASTTQNANTDGLEAGQKMYSMLVENYNDADEDSYFRMGYPDKSTWEEQAGTAGSDKGTGILMATHGSIKQKSFKNFFSQTSGISFKQDLSSSGSYSRGYAASIKIAGSTNVNATYDYTVALGFSTKFTVGTDVSVNYGIKFSSGSTKEYKNVSGPLVQQAKEILLRASDFDGKVKAFDKGLGGATVLAGITAAGTTIAAVPGELGTWSDSSINETLLVASEISSAATVAGSVAYALRKIKHEGDELKKSAGTESFIAMDNDSIVLSCDGSSIVINKEGIFINGKTLATGQLPGGAAKKEFAPNDDALKDAKVGQVFPKYINLNATHRVDVRAAQDIFLTTDANYTPKMKDTFLGGGVAGTAKDLKDPKYPTKGTMLSLHQEEAAIGATKDIFFGAEADMELDASGKFDITTKDAKFSGDINAPNGTVSDMNFKST
jgi:type VI secretion system VgrG family protein